MRQKFLILSVLLLVIAVGLTACSDEQQEPVEVTRIVEVEVPGQCPDVEEAVCPEVEAPTCPECPEPEAMETSPVENVVFVERWTNSAHNNMTAEAFNHWNEDDPAEVPTSCAKCHSTPGYLDFLGADGSEAGVVDVAAPIGTTVECEACHNDVTIDKTSVVFPSGIEITGLGDEARCMECHQGRHSTVSVNQSIADAGLEGSSNLDTVSEDLGFSNIHYYAAAATQYGTLAKGGYEYDGKAYDTRFNHVEGYDTCDSCHDPHTLEIQIDECVVCHVDVDSLEDFQDVRMPGSLVDYDGDGNLTEGVSSEINGLREILSGVMTAYSTEISEFPIGYSAESHPYFFIDTNSDGTIDEEEGVRDNAYATWTPRLAKAAYNYQVSLKDPGRFAHGGKYIIQLLYDSIEDLNSAVGEPVDMDALSRIDHGHFAGSEEAFRHWDEEGVVPGSCSRCHSADGLPLFIEQGAAINQHPSNGLACETCHSDVANGTVRVVDSVPFPNGAELALDDPGSNLCLNCHQGRESGESVNRVTNGLPDDEISESLRFLNVHYFAAGASLFGTEANGMYEYDGQDYNGQNLHVPAFNTCTECHYEHQLEVEVEECADCHFNVETLDDLHNIRLGSDPVDYDGDGDSVEGIGDEVASMQEMLYAAMQDYAANELGAPILYDSSAYPYFFNDLDGDGQSSPNEINSDNQYRSWSPRLLRAAYNYQYVAKDPGAFAHNGDYIMQVMYDTLTDLGADVSGMTRPPVVVVVPDTEG